MDSPSYLDPQLSTLLQSLRSRVRRYVVWDSLLAILAVVLSAFWIGLALDYLPVLVGGTEMPWLARTLLLLLVSIAVLVILITMLWGRLHRRLPDDSLALLVERHHPSLGGRLVTAVQLNEPGRRGDSHSPALLRQVHVQAAAAVDQVDPNRIFRWEPLWRKSLVVVPLLLAAVVFLLVAPQSFVHAASRLALLTDEPWPRRADLRMVGVELPVVSASDDQSLAAELVEFGHDKTLQLPQGSSGTLRIRAGADDAQLPVVCTVYYRTDSGTRGQSNMRRVGRVVDGFQSFVLDGPPLAGLSESLTLDIRGLDDRLDDFRIEAVPPPALMQVEVSARYPDYLRLADQPEVDMTTAYMSGLRLREGSDATLSATSSVPLGEVDVMVKSDTGDVTDIEPQLSQDGRLLQLNLNDIARPTTVSLVPYDRNGISAQAPYRYFLGVVMDEPPEVDLSLEGIGSAVTPIARIPVKASASDDYGVEEFTVSITHATQEGEQQSVSDSPTLDRQGSTTTVLDLRELSTDGPLPEIQPGGAVMVMGEVTDAYDLGPPHTTRSEVFRLEVVTADQLLALLERRELGLRARLEQTIDETRNLRDTLDMLRREGLEPLAEGETSETDPTRQLQVRRLRVQQSGLQANKTSEELAGIAAQLDDILREMMNNRIDSVDRRERLGNGVRDPLRRIVEEPLAQLRNQIREVEAVIDQPEVAKERTAEAVETAEEVLLQLSVVLDKMLDLESYNEILDIVRQLMDDQDELIEETQKERKERVLDLFK